ncbi:FAD-binding domain-containing protein [Zopfia rhizophila CBS 207.26]|uniref:FAD-binding domain-containing protein n=1 Tax=Zopfia rhizophila CBS 207.26 TaxID=1314779 RepID=A0A6A6EGN5_9PEZI|nr:FAD-binding domain-containing protein [Zopfia rhizophila CBS 207.26]
MELELEENTIYQTFLSELEGKIQILAPGIDGYEESIRRRSTAAEKHAAAVIFPRTTDEVSKIVKVARANRIEFVVCCGWQSAGCASSIENGIVIDLRKMNTVTVHEESKTLTVQGGCTWADVNEEASRWGLATVGGIVNHTSVGGHILGGGYGWLTARNGLAIDNLLEAELVLADGSIVQASSIENPDLFWAIRGAGASFAIATSFTLQAHYQLNPVWSGKLIFTADKLPSIVEFANRHHERAEDQGFIFGFMCPPAGFKPVIIAVPFYNGTQEDAKKYFKELLDIGPVIDQTSWMPYEQANATFNDHVSFGARKSSGSSTVKAPFTLSLLQAVFDEFARFIGSNRDAGVERSLVVFTLIPYKKIREVKLEDMAYANRGDYYNADVWLRWKDPALDHKARAFARAMSERIHQIGRTAKDQGVGAYANNAEHQLDAMGLFGVNTDQLVELKKKYDPDNVFRTWRDV